MADADAETSGLQSRFATNKPLEPDVLSELQSILRLHDLSAEDLFYKWESHCIKLDTDTQDLTLGGVRNLKQSIQDELEKGHRQAQVKNERKMAPHATPRSGGPRAPGSGGDVFGMLDGLVPTTPATGGSKLTRTGGSATAKRRTDTPKGAVGSSPATRTGDQLKSLNGVPAVAFADRANPGEIVEVLNEKLAPADAPIAPYPESRIKLMASSDVKKMSYKPLAMKLSEASEVLDDRIDEFATLVQEHHDLDDSAFGSAASLGTTEIVAVGRIASDSMEGRLNSASLVLETSRRTGMGLRVPLRMDKVPGAWSVFPGQIVALKGSNVTGNEFVVSEVLDMPLLRNAASTPAALAAHRDKLRGSTDPDAMDTDGPPPPLNIMLAAGPYTADDNLDYEPLHALCSQAADSYADALILTGPFLDVDHPLIATGDFDLPEDANHDPDTATLATLFKYLVAPAFARATAANPALNVVLVPSVRDVLDKHVSWPQDTIARKELGLPKAVRIVSNPMTLSVNEMAFGISAQDVLYELRSEELVAGNPGAAGHGDLMARLCRYLIEQRHYFPLFPPSDRAKLPKTGTESSIATGSMLDLSYLKLGEMVNVRPDVMLVPSLLPPFAKVVDSVLAINPGFLSKRKGAGTYARMTLHAPLADDSGAEMVSHRIFDRARVEIVRI